MLLFSSWLLALILLALAKFIPFIFKGQVPIAFDLFMGGYYPWLSDKWGFLVGVPVKNSSLSDVVSQTYPWLSLARDQILSGHFPFWNPTSLMGYPFFANYQMGVFYPTSFILLLGDLPQARTIQLFVQTLMGLVFMFIYLRSLNLSKISSITGAFIYTTAGHMTADFELSLGGRSVIWLPLALFLINMFYKKRNYWLLLPLALSEFSIITAGQIQTFIFTNLIILAIILMKFKFNIRASLWVVFALGLGALATSVQLFPTAELFFHSVRLNDPHMTALNYGILPLRHLLTLFVGPDIFGNPSTGNYFGFWDYLESVGYIGIISSLLIYLSFLNRGHRWLKVGLLVCLLFAFSNPIAYLPYKLNIPLLNTSAASRVSYPMNFFLTMLAAHGLDSFKNRKYTLKEITIPLTILTLIIIYFISNYLSGHSSSSITSLRNLFLPTGLFIAGVIMIFISSKYKKLCQIGMVIVAILIFLDLLRFHYKYNSFVKAELAFPPTPVTDYLVTHQGRFISTSSEVFPSNSWTPYHLDSMFGYENLAPSAIAGYFSTMNTNIPSSANSERYLDSVVRYDSSLLDLAGVKYIVTLKRDKVRKIDPNGYIRDDSIDLSKYKPVFSDRAVVILENQTPVGFAYLNYSPIITKDDTETLSRMLATKQPQAVFTSDKLVRTYTGKEKSEVVNLTQDIGGDISGEFTSKDNGILNVATTNYPGWQAVLDGKPAKILKANFLFIGIEVTPGKHSLLLKYLPISFTYGAIVSIASIAILLLTVFLASYQAYRSARHH